MTSQSTIRILSASALSKAVLTFLCLLFAVGTPAQEQSREGTYHDRWLTFTTFDAPAAGKGYYEGTVPLSINAVGDITGLYNVPGNVTHGFVRAANGRIVEFGAPGEGSGNNQGTFPFSINTAGAIAGYYSDANNVHHGFVRTAANCKITAIDVTGAQETEPISINAAGVITGGYLDANGTYHGFVRAANGSIATFDAPGAGTAKGPGTGRLFGTGTEPISINAAGVIAGN